MRTGPIRKYLQNSTRMNLLSVMADWKVSFSKTKTPWSFFTSSVLTKTANANSKRNFMVPMISCLSILVIIWKLALLWSAETKNNFDITVWQFKIMYVLEWYAWHINQMYVKTDIVNWKWSIVPQEYVEIGRRSRTERDEILTPSSRYKL